MNEQELFLNDITVDNQKDVLEMSLTPEKEGEASEEGGVQTKQSGEGDDDDEGGEIQPRNRRERRLMSKLAAERESASFLAGKLEAQNSARSAINEESDYLKAVESIYGTQTPEAQLATELLKKAIVGARDEAKRMAIEEMRTERQQESQAAQEAGQELDGYVEDIEDTYNVTLNEAQQRGFFTLLSKMSPKDREGNVIEYADPHAVWEVFRERMKSKGTDNRAKDLSSRSMVQSGASTESNLTDDAATRFLKESGII